ncbi:MAG: M28 family peptidase [Saprospiraceae bacterium]|nr:MAG: M28 family peptidase [Saprospiraceae bacterium]
MKKIISPFLLAFLAFLTQAQQPPQLATDAPDHVSVLTACGNAAPYAATITAEDLRSYLTILASGGMEGRETGTEGQRKAADFIASHFEEMGLPKIGDKNGDGEATYFQYIAYTSEKWENGQISLAVNGTKYRHLTDYYSIPSANSSREKLTVNEVVFLGFGIDDPKYSDYQGVDVKGKTILIYNDEPVNKKGSSYLTGTTQLSQWSSDWEKKLEAAQKHGVSTVFIIDPDIEASVAKLRSTLLSTKMKMGRGGQPDGKYANSYFISSTVAKEIAGPAFTKFAKTRNGIEKSGKPASMVLPCKVDMLQVKEVSQLTGSNVLGYIEGTDPKLKDEVVVITAHYDHLGKRGTSIFYGADDDGSGTVTVMDIAQAFAQAKKDGAGPRRSVLCMTVSGEEKGLLGSSYYSEHPVFPIENTVADLNIDMIGRMDDKHSDPNYIYIIGADRLSTTLHEINAAANDAFTHIALDYTYNDKSDPNRFYYRSDHYNFAKKGIPSVFFFSGVHEDYHQPGDTVDKIMFDKMENIAHLIFYTAWELANRDERIQVNVKEED